MQRRRDETWNRIVSLERRWTRFRRRYEENQQNASRPITAGNGKDTSQSEKSFKKVPNAQYALNVERIHYYSWIILGAILGSLYPSIPLTLYSAILGFRYP